MFPKELIAAAFRSGNGEYGWTRDQIPVVLSILVQRKVALLGGELWWVPDGASRWIGLIPQRTGPPSVHTWTIVRRSGESWDGLVARSSAESAAWVEKWPEPNDLPPGLGGRIL